MRLLPAFAARATAPLPVVFLCALSVLCGQAARLSGAQWLVSQATENTEDTEKCRCFLQTRLAQIEQGLAAVKVCLWWTVRRSRGDRAPLPRGMPARLL